MSEATHASIGGMPCDCDPGLEVNAPASAAHAARTIADWARRGGAGLEVAAQAELADPGQGPVVVAFNGQYLVDAISSIDARQVTLGASGPSSPALFRAPGGTRPESYVVVMPMHVAR